MVISSCGVEETAGSVDVFATRGADGGCYAMGVEIVAEVFHRFHVAALKFNVWNLVVADEVYAAVKSSEQA